MESDRTEGEQSGRIELGDEDEAGWNRWRYGMSANTRSNQGNQEPNFHLSKTSFVSYRISFYRSTRGEVTPKRRVALVISARG